MRRLAWLCVICCSTALATPRAAQAPATGAVVDRTLAAYNAGNYREIDRVLTADGNTLITDILWRAATWKRTWSPRRVAFTAEVVLGAARRQSRFTPELLAALRAMTDARVDKPGTRGVGDLVEATIHKVAMTALILSGRYTDADDYYRGITRRIAPFGATGATSTSALVEPRLVLAHAMTLEGHTRTLAGVTLSDGLRGVLPVKPIRGPSSGSPTLRQIVAEAHEVLKSAAQDPAIAAEAIVRDAYLYLREGNGRQAQALIAGMPRASDVVVAFWGGIVLARALEAQGRTDEAAAAYEALARIAPGTQTAAVALAALRLKQGDRSAAQEWAERARRTPPNRIDPWTMYWGGDARFLDSWLIILRTVPE
jgi:tetratricopeptide (TPR) repeat protein